MKEIKLYMYWKSRKRGRLFKDHKIGPGFYIPTFFGHNPIGMVRKMDMESGKTGIYQLVDFEMFRDPRDMVKESWWHFIGYEGEKSVKDCSFEEFLSIYNSKHHPQ